MTKRSNVKAAADWRENVISQVRSLMEKADADIVEERKWRKPSNGMVGVPVWSRGGIICTGETYKNYVKLTFAKGAELKDPSRLFNAGLDGNIRRAIDIREGEPLNETALTALIRAAVKVNLKDGKAT